ncbi:Glycosyl hydrolase catalytic core domain containing protein [Russula decolorans]
MAPVKFLHILTVVSLAILHASFDALSVNALIVDRGHVGRDFSHVHAEIAKKRGASSTKCRSRPTSASQSPAATTTNPSYAPSSNASEPAHTTSSSQSASTNAPASSIDSKVMYGWSNNEQPSLGNFATGSTRLVYNWKLSTYSDVDLSTIKNVEFVPTVHSISDVYDIPSVLKRGYAKYAKFFNEPEISSQANVPVNQAHELWMQYFEPLTNLGYNLVAPAVTGAGMEWMTTFLSLCNGKCSIYALDFHYYGLDVGEFETSVNSFHALLPSVPVWITELGCHDYSGKNQPCTQGVFDTFFPGVMSYVESTSWIEQAAWFGMFTTSEIPMGLETVNCMIACSGDNKECKPNSLGSQYINYH